MFNDSRKSQTTYDGIAASVGKPVTINQEKISHVLATFDLLPDSAFVRLPVLTGLGLGSPATIWRHVKQGFLPAPVRLSPGSVAWQVATLRNHIASIVEKGGAQ